MTITACGIVWIGFERTINHLYVMPTEQHVTGLVTLAVSVFGIIGCVVAAYMGTNAIAAKFGLSGVAQMMSSSVSVDDSKVTEFSKRFIDDPSYVQPEDLPESDVEQFR
jgi:hypothetical protein